MKKLMLGLMIAFVATAAEATLIDGIDYELDDDAGTATITSCDRSNPPTKVDVDVVEWEGQKYTVISVEMSAFAGCKSLTSVSLPNATTIGEMAFYRCDSLISVSLPKATTIGGMAFCLCGSLISVSLPNATSIVASVFDACGSLKEISLSSATEIGEMAFKDCGSLKEISLPNATKIGGSAFLMCSSLTSVSFPNVTTIEAWAFSGCSVLTSASFPATTSIGGWAFESCGSLTTASLPSTTSIGGAAFYLCKALSNLVVNAGMKSAIETNGRGDYGIAQDTTITYFDGLPYSVMKAAGYEVKEAVVEVEYKITPSSVTLRSGDEVLDEDKYKMSCEYFGVIPQTKPETPFTPKEEDLKIVSKDAQVIGSDEIAVTRESIAAAKAMTVQIVNGQVALGVSVCSNADITASSVNWAPVKFTKDTQIGLSADGTKLILPIPVAAQQGFMILQSGDAKVSEGGARVPVTGEPWYKPTVED